LLHRELVTIEARRYGPDSTSEDIEALRSRVCVLDDRIVLLREIPVQSPFSIGIMSARLQELVEPWDWFDEIVDLREAHRPDAATREALRGMLRMIRPRLRHFHIVVGRNIVIAAMAKLVCYASDIQTITLHSDIPTALEAARHAKR
jgi:hypothetical protein